MKLYYASVDQVQIVARVCQKDNHVQQVAYSTYHDVLTQICFTCKKIRTNMGD